MNKLELKIPPPALMVIVGALMWLAARATPAWGFAFAYQRELAIAVAVAAFVIAVSGVLSILLARTTISPVKPGNTSSLVVSGIYRFTRNPMYLGLLLVLVAWSVFLGKFVPLLFLPAFFAAINRLQILPEERFLAAKFGPAFAAYCARVRRW